MGIVTGLLKAQTWERVGKSGRVGRKDDENDKKPAGCWHSLMGTCISSKSSSSVIIRTTAESGSLNNGSKEPPVPQTRSSTGSSNSESNPSTPKAGGELKVASQLLKFTFNELKAATRNFRPESILGEGGFGCVFKGWIEENGTAPVKPGTGLTVAVKALNHDGLQGHKEWVAEVNFLGQLHHPNLVKLIGYCIEDDQRLLVYEFMPRGSLENHLFRKGSLPLPWSIRMKIALGAAKGLAFLHGGAERPVIYRDFKTSNILLDSEYNAKLSDFGLAKDGPEGDNTHVSTRVMGTYGYAAPEYVMTDLVPREIAEKWLKYLREELPTIAFKCNTQEQRSNLGWKSASKTAKHTPRLQTSDCLGAETLVRLLKNYSRSHEMKTSITVGVVGLPNVGKSSLINSIKRSRVANVGATPGLTRVMQEIQLDKHVKLLDCPGVVMAKSSDSDATIALRNCKRIEKLEDPISSVKEILKLCPSEKLMSLYKLPSFSSVDDFLQKIASIRGKLKKGGIADTIGAARIVLRDWNEGKIPYYTLPPARNEGEYLESAIVPTWGKEFDVNEIYGEDSATIDSLHSMIDTSHFEMPANCPLGMDTQLAESDEDAMEEADVAPDVMGMDLSETVATKSNKAQSQNDKLYDAEGIFNPHAAKSEKKRRKKAGKVPMKVSIEAGNDDYDFAVDYTRQFNAPQKEAESDKDDDDENIDGMSNDEGTAMAGVELDA